MTAPAGGHLAPVSGPRHASGWVAARQLWLAVAALLAAYLLAWALGPFILSRTPSDLDVFFWPSVATALNGHVLQIYSANDYGGYPNANGPVGLLPLVPLTALANLFGWANDIRVRAVLAGKLVGALPTDAEPAAVARAIAQQVDDLDGTRVLGDEAAVAAARRWGNAAFAASYENVLTSMTRPACG